MQMPTQLGELKAKLKRDDFREKREDVLRFGKESSWDRLFLWHNGPVAKWVDLYVPATTWPCFPWA